MSSFPKRAPLEFCFAAHGRPVSEPLVSVKVCRIAAAGPRIRVQLKLGSAEMGSKRSCGGAEQTSILLRSECRLAPFVSDRIVAAANVGSPPTCRMPGPKSEGAMEQS